jgi:hypothetical protein
MEAPMKIIGLIVLLLIAVPVLAKEKYAPLPETLMRAHSVFIENKTMDARIGDYVFREIPKWKRFVLVTDRAKADVVFVITENTHEAVASNNVRTTNVIGTTAITTGGGVYSYQDGSVTLEIVDADGTVWANTRAFSRKGAMRDLLNDLRDRIKRQEHSR